MSQHSLVVDDGTFPTVRQNINNALQALGTSNLGTSAPTVTYPGMLWADTTANLLKQRNSANNNWVTVARINQNWWGLSPSDIGAAPSDSPNLTGVPTTPTPNLSSADATIANTSFVAQIAENATGYSIVSGVGNLRIARENLLIKFSSSVVTVNSGGDGTVNMGTGFTSTPLTVLVTNGDVGVSAIAPVLYGSYTASSFNFRVPGLTNSSYRINWLAIGAG